MIARVAGIDVEVQIVMRGEHLKLLVPNFIRAGLPSTIEDQITDAYIASGEKVSYARWILEYGQYVLNPLMNQKLGRSKDHPTFNNMLKFALKEVIENDPSLILFRKFKEGSKA